MNRSTPGLPVHHQLPEFTQTHVHRISDAIQPSHPLSSPSPPAPNPSQDQSPFQEDLVLAKKKKKRFSQRNQWGLMGSRTRKRMKPVWVWYHASHGEGSYSLFSQGTWDISCASNVPQTKARELGFHSPPFPSFNYHPVGVPSKDKSKATIEAKVTKAQENVTSENV